MQKKRRKKTRIEYSHKAFFNYIYESKDRYDFMDRLSDVIHSIICELDERIDKSNTISYHVHANIIEDVIEDVIYLCNQINMTKIVHNQFELSAEGIFVNLRYKRPSYVWIANHVNVVICN